MWNQYLIYQKLVLVGPIQQNIKLPSPKTKSDFIARSVVTGLRRWTLVVAVINVDAYPFLALSDLTCDLKSMGIGVFWLHCAAR